jgi:small conductance mechanosensitive channel
LKAWNHWAKSKIAWMPWLLVSLMVASLSPGQMTASPLPFQTPPPSTATPQPPPTPTVLPPLTAASIPYYKQLITQLLLFVPRLVGAILIFLTFWIVAAIVAGIIRRVWLERTKDRDVVRLLEQTAKVSILIFGAVTALGTIGINVLALVAGLGLTGFALGFAFKDALSNYLSGVLLIIYKPFTHNDEISVSGQRGIVTDVNLRYTVLTNEKQTILIPNSQLFSNVVIIEARNVGAKSSDQGELDISKTPHPPPNG